MAVTSREFKLIVIYLETYSLETVHVKSADKMVIHEVVIQNNICLVQDMVDLEMKSEIDVLSLQVYMRKLDKVNMVMVLELRDLFEITVKIYENDNGIIEDFLLNIVNYRLIIIERDKIKVHGVTTVEKVKV